uniref:Uncharacterized protein n=1 Tax=Zea mays TaxID=4577 RepID=A0A804NGE7_MAIZE
MATVTGGSVVLVRTSAGGPNCRNRTTPPGPHAVQSPSNHPMTHPPAISPSHLEPPPPSVPAAAGHAPSAVFWLHSSRLLRRRWSRLGIVWLVTVGDRDQIKRL